MPERTNQQLSAIVTQTQKNVHSDYQCRKINEKQEKQRRCRKTSPIDS